MPISWPNNEKNVKHGSSLIVPSFLLIRNIKKRSVTKIHTNSHSTETNTNTQKLIGNFDMHKTRAIHEHIDRKSWIICAWPYKFAGYVLSVSIKKKQELTVRQQNQFDICCSVAFFVVAYLLSRNSITIVLWVCGYTGVSDWFLFFCSFFRYFCAKCGATECVCCGLMVNVHLSINHCFVLV